MKFSNQQIRFLLILTVTLISGNCFSQEWDSKDFKEKNNYIEVVGSIENIEEKDIPDHYAMYPDGKKGIYKAIAQNTKVPEEAIKQNINGTVILKYVVGTDGYVEDIEVVQSVHELLDKAAIDVIKGLDRWIPGEKNGKNVRVEYRQPFKFQF